MPCSGKGDGGKGVTELSSVHFGMPRLDGEAPVIGMGWSMILNGSGLRPQQRLKTVRKINLFKRNVIRYIEPESFHWIEMVDLTLQF